MQSAATGSPENPSTDTVPTIVTVSENPAGHRSTPRASTEFHFDTEKALDASSQLASCSDNVRALPAVGHLQSTPLPSGTDRVTQAVAQLLSAHNQVITSGSAYLAQRLGSLSQQFRSAATDVHQSETHNAHSLDFDIARGS